MCFWAPVLYATDDGSSLKELGAHFVGRHVIPRYRGYMRTQAERLWAFAAEAVAAGAAAEVGRN
jgi:hypothetical protein